MSDRNFTPHPSSKPENRTVAPTPDREFFERQDTHGRDGRPTFGDCASGAASEQHPGSDDTSTTSRGFRNSCRRTTGRAAEFAGDHPFAVGAIGLVAGFALGALLPRPKIEATAVTNGMKKAAEVGQETLHKARTHAEAAIHKMATESERDRAAGQALEQGLEDSFPASDPVSVTRVSRGR